MIGATTDSLQQPYRRRLTPSLRILGHSPGSPPPWALRKRKGDGWTVSGRWSFASASPNAHWLAGGCRLGRRGRGTLLDKRGSPEQRLFFSLVEQVTPHDTWHVSGLCGTGSGDMSVEGLELDEAFSVLLGAAPRVRTLLYRFPTLGLLALGSQASPSASGSVPSMNGRSWHRRSRARRLRRRLAERAPVQLALAGRRPAGVR